MSKASGRAEGVVQDERKTRKERHMISNKSGHAVRSANPTTILGSNDSAKRRPMEWLATPETFTIRIAIAAAVVFWWWRALLKARLSADVGKSPDKKVNI
jgi:hypothetical protein